MDWKILIIVFAILLAAYIAVLLWGGIRAWKTGNKFISVILFVLAIAGCLAFWAIFGNEIKAIFG